LFFESTQIKLAPLCGGVAGILIRDGVPSEFGSFCLYFQNLVCHMIW